MRRRSRVQIEPSRELFRTRPDPASEALLDLVFRYATLLFVASVLLFVLPITRDIDEPVLRPAYGAAALAQISIGLWASLNYRRARAATGRSIWPLAIGSLFVAFTAMAAPEFESTHFSLIAYSFVVGSGASAAGIATPAALLFIGSLMIPVTSPAHEFEELLQNSYTVAYAITPPATMILVFAALGQFGKSLDELEAISPIESGPADGRVIPALNENPSTLDVDDAGSLLATNLGITTAQSRVVALLAQGKTNAEIAEICETSVRTTESHIDAALKATSTRNRTELAVQAALTVTHLHAR